MVFNGNVFYFFIGTSDKIVLDFVTEIGPTQEAIPFHCHGHCLN